MDAGGGEGGGGFDGGILPASYALPRIFDVFVNDEHNARGRGWGRGKGTRSIHFPCAVSAFTSRDLVARRAIFVLFIFSYGS